MRYLSNKEIRNVKKFLEKYDKDFIKKIDKLMEIKFKKYDVLLWNKIPYIIKIETSDEKEIYVPTLQAIYSIGYVPTPWVKVDDGARDKILKGADVFRPGITEYSYFSEYDPICILDSKDHPIAVGYAIVDSEYLERSRRGKVVKNLHHLGDALFELT